MRDGNVPRFFLCGKGGAGKAQLVGRLAAQLSGLSFPARSCSSFLGDCWHRKKKQKEGRKGTGGWEGMERKKLEGMEESGKLLVEQIKTKTARSRAALYSIIVPQFALPFQRPEGSH